MFRRPTPVIGAALLATTLAVAPAVAFAADEPADSEPQNTGVIEIPYGEPGELAPGEGVQVDCAAIPEVDGLTIGCDENGLVLTVDGFDAAWGERVLPVRLVTGSTSAVVDYRVVLGPPPAPEITRPRVDAPFPVGGQALVPLSLLGITCGLCSADVATVEVVEVAPATAFAGVGTGHLAVRSGTAGDVVVLLRVHDDAGQSVEAEVTVSFAGGTDAAPRALHVFEPPAQTVDLASYAWGDGLSFSCPSGALGASCSTDGRAQLAAIPAEGDQFAFRVVDADGRQSLGSVTFQEAGDAASVVPVSWAKTAELGIRVPPADDGADESAPPLSDLARILQEVPRS